MSIGAFVLWKPLWNIEQGILNVEVDKYFLIHHSLFNIQYSIFPPVLFIFVQIPVYAII